MKKNLFTKAMSVFLSVMMILSCWVFVPSEHNHADALANINTYRKADKYGTPYWDGTNTYYSRWNSGGSYTTIKWPKHIYLDVSETLQSAGYYYDIEWYYGSGTDYRIINNGFIFGGYGIGSGWPDNYYTMTNMFNNYSLDGSLSNGGSQQTSNVTDGDLFIGVSGLDWDGAKTVILRSRQTTNNEKIFMMGTPKTPATGRYSTSGSKPDSFGGWQQWKRNKWQSASDKYTKDNGSGNWTTDCYEGEWKEVAFDITIYNKSDLNTAITNAKGVYNDNSQYSAYVLNDGLNKIKTAYTNGETELKKRVQTQSYLDSQTSSINSTVNGVQFQAKNAGLKSAVSQAEALINNPGFEVIYTTGTKNALKTAVDTAKQSKYYSSGATVYTVGTNRNAGQLASNEQAEIDTLTNNVNAAIKALIRKYDVGYANIFSLIDWTASAKGSLSHGTLTVDVDRGTIEIAHDGSDDGTDNNTSQQPTYYKAEVEGDTEYVLAWDTEGEGRAQIHVFYTTGDQWTYTVNSNYNSGSHWFVNSGDLPYSENMGKHEVVFRTLPETDGLVFRFGTCNSGDKVKFSNIRLVKKSVYDEYAKDLTTVRQAFEVGATDNLSYTPARSGYTFLGWFDANGNEVKSVAGLTSSTVVYAQWKQALKVKFYNYDGTYLGESDVVDGVATAPEKPAKAPDGDYEYNFIGWDKDIKNVTENLEVTAQYEAVEHGNVQFTITTNATCTAKGKKLQWCEFCGYDWGEVEIAMLPHDYANVEQNSSTGVDGQHKLVCSRQNCGAYIMVDHNYGASIGTSDATCTTPGATYFKCACLQEKTEYGVTNPNKHIYDYTTATPNGDSINHTVYCTENAAHTITVACTDNDKNCYCDVCGQELIHSYVNKTTTNVKTEADCEVPAVYYLTCQCGKYSDATWTDETSALEHNWTETTKYLKTAANCTDGSVYYKECSLCGISSESKTGATWTADDATNHNFSGDYVSNNNGTHVQKCVNGDCTATGNEKACTYGDWTKDNASTHSHTCTACEYTPAAENHTWSEWAYNGLVSENQGEMIRTCEVCKREETTNCKYDVIEKVDADCENDGYMTYKCTEENCTHSYTVITEEKSGHSYTGDAVIIADGKHAFKCVNGCDTTGIGAVKGETDDCTEFTYTNVTAGTHNVKCKTCGYNYDDNCSGGTATCTAQAVCELCYEAYGKTAPHSYTCSDEYLHKATEATCTKNETYYYYCAGCKATVAGIGTYEKEGTMLPHNYTGNTWYDGAELAEEAKCEVNEKYYVYCADCLVSSKGTASEATFEKEGTALVHSYKGTVTCNNDGTHTIQCERDGCTSTMDGTCVEFGMTYGLEQPTCTQQGYTNYQCGVCQYSWKDNYTDPLGHDYAEKIYDAAHLKEEANCEHARIYWYDCSRCDKNAKNETDAKYTDLTYFSGNVREHSYTEKVDAKYLVSAATCTAAAKYYKSCKYDDCGVASTETFTSGAALGHDWVHPADDVLADYLATESDCVTDATYYYVCSRAADCGVHSSQDVKKDGETWTKENSKSGHALTYHEAVAATCEVNGNIEYWSCSRCNKNFSDAQGENVITGSVVLFAPGHSWVKYSAVQPTCEQAGHSTYEECSVCKVKKAGYTEYPATGHNYTGTWTYDAATGYHSKNCVNECGTSGIVDAEGNHIKFVTEYDGLDYVITGGEKCSFDNAAETKTVDGIHSHKLICKCGNESSKAYTDDETFVETILPTCTLGGYDSYECKDCGDTWKKNEVAASGHDWAENATPNGDGTHSVKCSACDATKDTVKCSGGTSTCNLLAVCALCGGTYGELGTHTLADDAWTSNNDATCTEDGTQWQNCSSCGEKQTRTELGSALGHNMSEFGYTLPAGWDAVDFDESTVKAPTCHEEGLEISYCQREGCMHYVTYVVKADTTKHVFDDNWVTLGGNCATGVTKARYCTVENCSGKETKVEKVAHDMKLVVSVKESCEEAGYVINECTVCKFTETVKGNDATGHSWKYDAANTQFVEEKKATCANAGRGYYVCNVCGKESEKQEIAKLMHVWDTDNDGLTDEGFTPDESGRGKYIYVNAEDATCTAPGHKGYYKCLSCSYDQHLDTRWINNSEDYIAKLPHVDKDVDGKCDECNAKLGTGTSTPNDNCDCICHREGWFMQFIYKIIKFFWKLFKIGKSCDCGLVHY